MLCLPGASQLRCPGNVSALHAANGIGEFAGPVSGRHCHDSVDLLLFLAIINKTRRVLLHLVDAAAAAAPTFTSDDNIVFQWDVTTSSKYWGKKKLVTNKIIIIFFVFLYTHDWQCFGYVSTSDDKCFSIAITFTFVIR